jgi:hypothetical protein
MDEWETHQDITWLLSGVGRGLLLIAGIRFFTIGIPFRLMEPEWYLLICRELINLSPVLLTGLAMLLVSSRVAYDKDPNPVLPPWGTEHRRLRWLAMVFALLIPVQIVATVLFDLNVQGLQSQQLKAVQRDLKQAREGPQILNGDLRVQQLQAIEMRMLGQQRRNSEHWFALGIEALRVCGSAAVVAWLLLVGALRPRPW